MWNWQIEDLSKKYKVIVYDLFGHGHSKDPEGDISLKLFSDQILELIRELQTNIKMSILFISHDLSVVQRIADYVCIMQNGKIIELKGRFCWKNIT